MTQWIRRGVLAGAVVAAAGLVVSCGSDDGTTPTTAGAIEVTVMAEGAGVSGVTAELFAEGGSTVLQTETTDGQGQARFTGVEPGTYEVEITVPDGYAVTGGGPTRQTVQVAEGQDGAASYALEPTGGSGSVVEVHLTNYAFTPADLTIEPGTTVRWINDTNTFHTVTPDGHSEWTEASLSSSGQTFSHTFDAEGSFPYYCSPHRSLGMVGSVTVAAPQR